VTVDVFSALLSYATVPVYVLGLLFLIYIIARTQLGFTFTGQVKEVVKSKVAERRPKTKTPIISYLVVAAMFVLFIGATIVTERKQRL
jgi:heme O synthase-like polyprenyltransferase